MSVRREAARKRAWNDATIWLSSKGLTDFTWLVASHASGKRGEDRVGYALGILCALETRAHIDNE